MAKSCLVKLIWSLLITGCIILCCSVCVRAALTYADDTVVSYELDEGENVTIDCTTTEPAYHTALSFHRKPVPLFYMVPNGQKLIQKGQTFTITNLTEQDAGDYGCLVKDKSLQNSIIFKAEVFVITPKPDALPYTVQKNKTVVETAATKLSGSKPYVYFKVKSPLRVPVAIKKPFNISVSVKGLQPIKIQWQKDQHVLVIGSRYKTFNDDRRLLVESPLTVEDSGTYSATACNTQGCQVRGVQVIFYAMPNKTFMKQYEEQGEGFIGDFVKEYGYLGVPLFLAIILVCAIAYTSGYKEKQKERKKSAFVDELKEIQLQKHRGQGRTASLWSWHSEGEEGESSDDDIPDYDKMKYKHTTSEREHGEYPEMHGYEEDYEGHEQHYSDREIRYEQEITYEGEEHRRDHVQQVIDSSEDVYRHEYKTTDDSAAYGLEGHHGNEEVPFTTSEHVAPLKKVSEVRITVKEEPKGRKSRSIFGFIHKKLKRPPKQSADQVTQDTIASDTQVTMDTVASDTHVTKDTVSGDTHVTQDTVTRDTQVTQDNVTRDTYVTQDTVSSVAKVSQGTFDKDTTATEDEEHEREQVFGTRFGYVKHQVKRIEGVDLPTEVSPTHVKPDMAVSDTQDRQDTIEEQDNTMIGSIFGYMQSFVRPTKQTPTQVTEGTIHSDTQVTQDKVASDTKVTQDTVTSDKQVKDTDTSDKQVTQDTVTSDTQVTQDTKQEVSMFGSIFGYMQGFVRPTEQTPTHVTEDTIHSDTQVTQAKVSSDTKVTQDRVASETKVTQDTVTHDTKVTQDTATSDKQVKDTDTSDKQVPQDTVASDTQVTQDTVTSDTQVTQDTVTSDTQVTQVTVTSDTQVTQDTKQEASMFGSIFGYMQGFVRPTEQTPTHVTEDTIHSDTQATQDKVTSDTQVTQDTVTSDKQVTQDTITRDKQVTQDTITRDSQVAQDTATRDTQVTKGTVTQDKAVQDTVAGDTKVTQDTVTSDTQVTQDTKQEVSMFGSIFGYMQGFVRPTEQTPTHVTEDTIHGDTQATQDKVSSDTKVTQDRVASGTQVTKDAVTRDAQVTQDTVSGVTQVTATRDTLVTQDTVSGDTQVTHDTVTSDTEVTQETIASDTQDTEQPVTMFGSIFGWYK